MNKKKIIVIAVIFVLLLIASNLLGGIIGFEKGFKAGLYLDGLNTYITTSMLQQLRKGKTELPIKYMEAKLDMQIYNIETYKTDNESIYNILKYPSVLDFEKQTIESMNIAIKYRREIPSSSDVPEFQKSINEILTKHEHAKTK
ncbi:MAG: hypothetical protein ABSF79_04960 [Smithellaceae bacterium]|jgi:hypothetical protein